MYSFPVLIREGSQATCYMSREQPRRLCVEDEVHAARHDEPVDRTGYLSLSYPSTTRGLPLFVRLKISRYYRPVTLPVMSRSGVSSMIHVFLIMRARQLPRLKLQSAHGFQPRLGGAVCAAWSGLCDGHDSYPTRPKQDISPPTLTSNPFPRLS